MDGKEKERLVWWMDRNSGSWKWASESKKFGLLVLLTKKGQVSGSWRRISGVQEFGKVSGSNTWRFFLSFWTRRRRRLVRQEGVTGSVPEMGSTIGTIDEEGDGSSEGLVLKERIKRRGVWSVIPLDVKKMELLVGKTPGGRLLCSWCWLIFKGRSLRLDKRYR